MGIADKFKKAVYAKQFSDPAYFGRRIDNFTHNIVTPDVAEVIGLSLDCHDGPTTNDMYKVLVQAAEQGFDPAINLINQMAETFETTYADCVCDDGQQQARPENGGQTENLYIPSFLN